MLGKITGLSPETLHQIRSAKVTGDPKREALIRFVPNPLNLRGTINERELSTIRAASYTVDRVMVALIL
ncbi:hypothetical protein [Burkholderia sp. THE68]|uniref:hypothetical protein n=1 Tax=Burkholderia sp. THE68 TaxID=758782 RepID=UPI001389D812|nr:hypothetical protein [Burkholderia sp. THE68]